ncbi:MAG: hypothetical protein JSV21_05160 [Nitrospirota bacterium]|nr:MAG: hypothetical protein JSV21_05160 [Nitrospirota bacterium]
MILGTWYWNDENETGFVHIGLNEDTGLLRIIMVDIDSDNELDESEYSGHTSSLKDNSYLNIKAVRPKDDNTGYMIIKYSAKKAELGIALMESKVIEVAVNEGKLRGSSEQCCSSVQINEVQEKLQEFVLKYDKELFPDMKYLKKLALPK